MKPLVQNEHAGGARRAAIALRARLSRLVILGGALGALLFCLTFSLRWGRGPEQRESNPPRLPTGPARGAALAERAPVQKLRPPPAHETAPPNLDSARALDVSRDPGGTRLRGMVIDATGGPVIGALVTARSSQEAVLAVASSGEDGRFSLAVGPGEIDLVAQSEAYSPALLRVRAPAAGLVLALGPAGRIDGDVVEADSQQPVPGVVVYAIAQRNPELTVQSNTALDGTFLLGGLRGGVYELFASSPHWRSPSRWVGVEVGQTSDPVRLQVEPATSLTGLISRDGEPCASGHVEVTGPGNTYSRAANAGRIELEGLLPGSYSITVCCEQTLSYTETLIISGQPVQRAWELTSGLHVAGRVESPAAEAVPGAWVNVNPIGEPGGRSNASCKTDATGAFVCAGLSAGEYELSVLTDDGAPLGKPIQRSLIDSDVDDLLLRTDAHGTIYVTLNEDPAPARVFASNEHMATFEASARADDYAFEHLPAGNYRVYVGLFASSKVAGSQVQVAAGQVARVALAVPARAAISGQVVDARGMPVLNAWVNASPSDAVGPRTPVSELSVLTNDSGEFELVRLLPGNYDLAVHSGAQDGHLASVPAGSHAVTLSVVTRASLSGTVLARSGAPVSRFELSYTRVGGSAYEMSGEQGRFRLPDLEPGTYRLEVASEAGTGATQVMLAPGTEQEVAITLSPPE